MKHKLSIAVKLGYGMGNLGECIAMNVYYIYFIFFLTSVVGLNAGIAGTISMIAIFWGAFTDLFAGVKSDTSTHPKGRRRPFIIKFSIPLGIVTFLMYTDWSAVPMGGKAVYFLAASLIFWLSLSLTDIPYLSLGSEITSDYAERTSIRGFANVLNYLGMMIASSGTLMLVSFFSDDGSNASGAWSKTGLCFGLVTFAAYWISARATKGKEPVSTEAAQQTPAGRETQNIVKLYTQVLTLKPFKYILFYTMTGYLGGIIMTSIYIYYLSYNLGLSDNYSATVMLLYCIGVIVLSTILASIKIEKRIVVVVLTFIPGAVLLALSFMQASILQMVLFFLCLSAYFSAYFVQVYSMVYDVCDLDEFVNAQQRAGAIVSVFYFVGKVIGGLGMFAVGWILEWYEFDPAALEQSSATLNGIINGAFLIPGILLLLGGLFIFRYPITSSKFAALRSAIEDKEAGNEHQFKDLI